MGPPYIGVIYTIVALGAEATVAMVGPEVDCSATASSRACLKGMFFLARICCTLSSKIHLGQVLEAAV